AIRAAMLDRRSPLDPGPAPADDSAATRLGEEQDLDLRAGRPDDFFSVIVNSSVSESRTRGPPASAGRIRAQLDSRNRTPPPGSANATAWSVREAHECAPSLARAAG